MGACPWERAHSLYQWGSIYTFVLGTRAFMFSPRFRMSRATSQRHWWLELKAANGAASYTSDASRRTCCLSKCDKFVLCRILSRSGWQAIFYGLPSTSFVRVFCVFAQICSLFFSKKKVPVVTWCPPRISSREWSGTACRTTSPLAILGGGLLRSKWRFVFSLLVFVAFLALAGAFMTGACCRYSWPPIPHNIAEVEPGACFFLGCFCACVCVFACVLCWQDLTKTAYVVGGGDLLPLLGGLQEELYVQPRGKWHIPPRAAKTAI